MSDTDPASCPAAAHPRAQSIQEAVVKKMGIRIFRYRLDGLPRTGGQSIPDAKRGSLIQVGDDIFRNFTTICVDRVVPRLRTAAEDRQIIIDVLMSPVTCARIFALSSKRETAGWKDSEAGDAFRICLALDSQSTSKSNNDEVPFWFGCIFNVLAEAAENALCAQRDPDSLLHSWRKIKAPKNQNRRIQQHGLSNITIEEKGPSTKALRNLVARRTKVQRIRQEQETNGYSKDLRLNLIGMHTKRAPKDWELSTAEARKQRALKDSQNSSAVSQATQDPISALHIPAPSPALLLPSFAPRSFGRPIQ
ncbi:hypothetical protein FB45DRAFT_1050935 [Roridomyces roridus]|uniref:Uncharacterized protein n=1 Tax=Roridomyces roridus TaxID=1738132 RepID=A0AAD7CL98_9AGAR|nr:hypothetical protein FB45DRAFT_1050935 [Roridomyces roridus]